MRQTVRLVLRVSRFRCTNEACPRKTFTERLPNVVPAYARCTSRLITVLRAVALEAGAETGARVLHHVGIQTGGDTLLRIMRRTPVRSEVRQFKASWIRGLSRRVYTKLHKKKPVLSERTNYC